MSSAPASGMARDAPRGSDTADGLAVRSLKGMGTCSKASSTTTVESGGCRPRRASTVDVKRAMKGATTFCDSFGRTSSASTPLATLPLGK